MAGKQSEDNMKIVNRKTKGFSGELHPGITMHKIPVQAGFPGVLFTIGSLAIFLLGIAALKYFLVFAIVLGIVFSIMLRFIPREAGGIMLVLTGVMIVWLAGFPSIDWPEKIPAYMLSSAIVAPPPPQYETYQPLAFKCDCQQRTNERDRGQKRPQPPSVFDGTWEGNMNDLPGVNLIVADAGGGKIGGVVAFYLQTRGDDGQWRVAGKSVAPLLAAHVEGNALLFDIQHHKRDGSREFGPNAKFRVKLDGDHEAVLYNMSETASPVKLWRYD